eukprot:TRINITY_DN26580_c0_g1_i1.p1 TRINITY_DN26580_c0_g1~~TRINITY_DN26580_c0_g1_i1.p1  ORF type:complete len:1025 (+),score=70.19 TRINITY_DN26580_c0_g1_i1:260-3334(+)
MGQLVKWFFLVCFLGGLILCYIEVIYIPHKRTMDDQQAAIHFLEVEVDQLRTSGRAGTSGLSELNMLRRRVRALEDALQEASPSAAAAYKKAVVDMEDMEADANNGNAELDGSKESPEPKIGDVVMLAGLRKAVEMNGQVGTVQRIIKSGKTVHYQLLMTDSTSKAFKRSNLIVQHSAPSESSTMTNANLPSGKQKRPVTWREDKKCGPTVPLPSGKPTECNPDGEHPCCSTSGWCGNSPAHCDCEGCVSYITSGAQDDEADVSSKLAKYSERTPKTIALVVPFRDRGVHYERFQEKIRALANAWTKNGVRHKWVVFVVEQFDTLLFNRGYLFNVGFKAAEDYAKRAGQQFDCVVMHDVDILPQPDVDYGWCIWPNQLSGEIACWQNSVPYQDNVGGVVSLSPAHWKQINGFSNDYEGWGGEDDDLYLRLKQHKLLKGGCHTFCRDRPKIPMVHRPALGHGRFTCLHDGDHTPRQRSPNDAAMWSRINEMKSGSKRWRSDGITNVNVHEAGERTETPACTAGAEECSKRGENPFEEVWIRASSKPIASPVRIRVTIEHCKEESKPLTVIPADLEHLRMLLRTMFPSSESCKGDTSWADSANFVALDVISGQSLIIGHGVKAVLPDSSMPAVQVTGSTPPKTKEGSEHLVQGQRLSRWIRRLPMHHPGLIYVPEKAPATIQDELTEAGRWWSLTAPTCISQAFMDSSAKYRITAGTTWCGDGGWSHVAYFTVLRSASNIPASNIIPICVAYNPSIYTYRFERCEDCCIGQHKDSGSIVWKHTTTLHTFKDATGKHMCVGFRSAGDKTRWSIMGGERCDQQGFTHVFSFRDLEVSYQSPFARACLLQSTKQQSQPPLQQIVMGKDCPKPGAMEGEWRLERNLTLLSKAHTAQDVKVCPAWGQPAGTKSSASAATGYSSKVFKMLRGAECSQKRLTTDSGVAGRSIEWTTQVSEPRVFLPFSGSGVKLCLCQLSMQPPPSGSKSSGLPWFTWVEGACEGHGGVDEMCFRTLSDADLVKSSYLVDEVV